MSSDVRLYISDTRGKVRVERWLSGNSLADCLRQMRPPDTSPRSGLETWAVSPEEVEMLAFTMNYVDSPKLDEVLRWISRYPAPHYTWVVERDF